MNGDVNHYAANTAITRSLVTGSKVRALCGEMFVATTHGSDSIPGSETGSKSMPNCIACDIAYSTLKVSERKQEEVYA